MQLHNKRRGIETKHLVACCVTAAVAAQPAGEETVADPAAAGDQQGDTRSGTEARGTQQDAQPF